MFQDPDATTAITGAGAAQGLDGAYYITASSDGKQVYVTGHNDDAVVMFNRNTSTGVLTYSAVIKDDNKGGTADGLDGANYIVVSPDGKQVYVAGGGG